MADFGFANKSNSSDFSSTGDKVNEVFGDLLLNRTELEAMITSLKRRQYGATPPANPNTGDIWECSTTGGGYTATVVYRYNGSAWAELVASAINVPNRNTVLQGKVTAAGAPDLFEAGTGLAVKLNATATPAIFAFMNGNSTSLGTVDIVAAVSADAATFWSSLPTSSTVYLYVDYTAGTVSGGFTTVAPVYQNVAPTHSAGLHWLDFNTGKVWSSDGSAWTQRNRIFVGTATTDGSGVTAVSVYAYNQTQGTSVFDDIITKGPWVDVRYFGAVGDGVTDDTAAIQAALSDTTVNVLYFPTGYYLLKGSGAELLTLTRGIKIFGDGKIKSCLLLDPTVPPTTDLLVLRGVITNLLIEDIGFIRTGTSTTIGRNMLYIDLSTSGHMMHSSKINRCYFEPCAGSSIKLLNVSNTDGFFTSSIEDCVIYGGINLEKSGDSISIVRNKIGFKGTGITLSTISGCMRTLISENNITSANGAISLSNTDQVTIVNNQMESLTAKETQGALISVTGGTNVIIEGNNMNNNGYLNNAIEMDNTDSVTIDKNVLYGIDSHVYIGSGCKNTYIGNKNVPMVSGTKVNNLIIYNNGVGTTNVDIPVGTLLNSWVADDVANLGEPRCIKSDDGTVFMKGQIAGGTATSMTQLFTLPEGFRPKRNTILPVHSESSYGVGVVGAVLVALTGEVYIRAGHNFMLNLSGIQFKAENYLA